jgi:hypothetical protein
MNEAALEGNSENCLFGCETGTCGGTVHKPSLQTLLRAKL